MRRIVAGVALAAVAGAVFVATAGSSSPRSSKGAPTAQTAPSLVFTNPRKIDNRYLPLSAKRRCVYRGTHKSRSVFTRLDQTRRFTIAGKPVDAAVFSDVDYEGGEVAERALDYFAQADDGTVYYLGERVRNYEDGKVADTSGSWLFGKDTDVPGVAMPAAPKVGDRWHNEDVPDITTESDVVEEDALRTKAAGRLFTDVIRTKEFSQPDGEVEYKLYAAGVGIIVSYEPDGRAVLVGCS